jgi:tetratricopeptide (TPR) repeat protein
VVSGSSAHAAADDISGVYITLLSARKDAGDESGAREVALRWSAFLDGAAAVAPTPEARSVFDSHRLSAYIETGQPEKAVPMLEASERDLPDDYNPPARLAVAYKAMRRFDDALAASSRALKRAYGPRQLLILQTRSDIQAASGDTAAAVATLRDALAVAEALPEGQRSARTVEILRKEIETPGTN